MVMEMRGVVEMLDQAGETGRSNETNRGKDDDDVDIDVAAPVTAAVPAVALEAEAEAAAEAAAAAVAAAAFLMEEANDLVTLLSTPALKVPIIAKMGSTNAGRLISCAIFGSATMISPLTTRYAMAHLPCSTMLSVVDCLVGPASTARRRCAWRSARAQRTVARETRQSVEVRKVVKMLVLRELASSMKRKVDTGVINNNKQKKGERATRNTIARLKGRVFV